MTTLLAEIRGFAPAGLIENLKNALWEPILDDDDGGSAFEGIGLAGRMLVKDGGSEDTPYLVVVTDESTGEKFEVRGQSFAHIPELMLGIYGGIPTYIMRYPLCNMPKDGFVEYTVQVFPTEWVD